VTVRRVVTGQDADGKSLIVRDEVLEGAPMTGMGGLQCHTVWASDTPPALPWNLEIPVPDGYFAPASGYRWRIFVYPPNYSAVPQNQPADAAEGQGEPFGEALDVFDTSSPGMHTTDTVDHGIVLSGEIWCELDGTEFCLKAGDTLIQQGGGHAWHNRSDQPCVYMNFAMGARRAPIDSAAREH